MIAWILCSTKPYSKYDMNLANGRTPHPHPSKLVDTSIARKHWKDEVFIVLWWCQLVFSQLVLPVLPLATSETLPRQRLHMQIMTRCGAHSDTTHTTPVTQQDWGGGRENLLISKARYMSRKFLSHLICCESFPIFRYIQVQFLKSSKKSATFSVLGEFTFCRICFWYLKSSVFSQPQLGHHLLMNWIMMSYCFAS